MPERLPRLAFQSDALHMTLEQFLLAKGLRLGAVGMRNAVRLLAVPAATAFSDETITGLQDVANGAEQVADFVAPALRTVEDLSLETSLHYHPPEKNASWTTVNTWGIDEDKAVVDLYALPSFCHRVRPNYPGLIDSTMHAALRDRSERHIHSAGRFAILLSHYDRDANHPRSGDDFQDIIRRTARYYKILHPPRIPEL